MIWQFIRLNIYPFVSWAWAKKHRDSWPHSNPIQVKLTNLITFVLFISIHPFHNEWAIAGVQANTAHTYTHAKSKKKSISSDCCGLSAIKNYLSYCTEFVVCVCLFTRLLHRSGVCLNYSPFYELENTAQVLRIKCTLEPLFIIFWYCFFSLLFVFCNSKRHFPIIELPAASNLIPFRSI